jgi:hypothetical protein
VTPPVGERAARQILAGLAVPSSDPVDVAVVAAGLTAAYGAGFSAGHEAGVRAVTDQWGG